MPHSPSAMPLQRTPGPRPAHSPSPLTQLGVSANSRMPGQLSLTARQTPHAPPLAHCEKSHVGIRGGLGGAGGDGGDGGVAGGAGEAGGGDGGDVLTSQPRTRW
eukprot:scaffold136127_cov22-Tisochrysis_lutea.AAC.1